MSQGRGFLSTMAIDFETAYGDGGAGSPQLLNFNTHTLKGEQRLVTPATQSGRRDQPKPFAGYKRCAGDVIVPMSLGQLPYWLQAAFGQETSPWKVQNTVGSFALIDNIVGTSKAARYSGCKVGRLSLAFGGDDELAMTLSIVGAKEDTEAGPVAGTAAPTLTRITHAHVTSITEGGSADTRITRWSCNIDFGLDELRYLLAAGGVASEQLDGKVSVTGSLTAILTDDTLLAKANDQTETSFVIVCTVGTATLTITVQEVLLEHPTKSVQGPQGRVIEANWQAYFDDAGTDKSAIEFAIAAGA